MPMLTRLGGAFILALAATIAVFWVMQSLIHSGGSVLKPEDFGRIQSFVMNKQDDDVQTKDRQPKKPPVDVGTSGPLSQSASSRHHHRRLPDQHPVPDRWRNPVRPWRNP